MNCISNMAPAQPRDCTDKQFDRCLMVSFVMSIMSALAKYCVVMVIILTVTLAIEQIVTFKYKITFQTGYLQGSTGANKYIFFQIPVSYLATNISTLISVT